MMNKRGITRPTYDFLFESMNICLHAQGKKGSGLKMLLSIAARGKKIMFSRYPLLKTDAPRRKYRLREFLVGPATVNFARRRSLIARETLRCEKSPKAFLQQEISGFPRFPAQGFSGIPCVARPLFYSKVAPVRMAKLR
jgi:hypothetical protein